MWALIDNSTNIVLGCLVGITYEEATIEASKSDAYLVEMTIENTPAYIGNKYVDGKFLTTEEIMQ
jgi:hypothetical protein